MSTITFGSVHVQAIALTAGSAQSVSLTRGDAPVHLHIVRKGAVVVSTGGDEVSAPAGAVVLVAADRHRLMAPVDARVVSIELPGAVLDGIGLPVGVRTLVSSDSALLSPFVVFCARLVDAGAADASSLAVYYLERLLQEMSIGLLVDASRARSVPRSAEQFTIALSIITAQLSDPDLAPATIAAGLNTSLRRLQRQFRRHGTTIDREIRRARVEEAARMLSDRHYDALSIGQIAEAVGFAGASSLARAMAAEEMVSPARLRRDSRAERAATPPQN